MRNTAILVITITAIFSSCDQGGSTVSETDQVLTRIDSLETIYFKDKESKADPKTGMALVRSYAKYYRAHGSDSLAVDMLFKAGEVSMGLGQGNLAVKYFNALSEDHASFHKAPEALFLTGFCSENLNQDTAQARTYYQKFIDTYPDHHLAQDAQFSIQNLGMSDEELIKMFEAKLNSQE